MMKTMLGVLIAIAMLSTGCVLDADDADPTTNLLGTWRIGFRDCDTSACPVSFMRTEFRLEPELVVVMPDSPARVSGISLGVDEGVVSWTNELGQEFSFALYHYGGEYDYDYDALVLRYEYGAALVEDHTPEGVEHIPL